MTARAARVRACAKINLCLRVGPRDASGYHEIETVFLRLELDDTVLVRTGGGTRAIECRGADVGPREENLAFRAAEAYASHCGWPEGFAIDIEKRIPVMGGLGGGSADAGAVLRGLNALAPAPLPGEQLLEIAASLGADVPFLASEFAMAIAWGRGDKIRALAPLPSRPVLVWVFPFGVSAREAYGWLDELRTGAGVQRGVELDGGAFESWGRSADWPGNDLEVPVVAHHGEIGSLIKHLRSAGVTLAQMAGSGSSVFAVLEDEGQYVAVASEAGARRVLTRTATSVPAVERLS